MLNNEKKSKLNLNNFENSKKLLNFLFKYIDSLTAHDGSEDDEEPKSLECYDNIKSKSYDILSLENISLSDIANFKTKNSLDNLTTNLSNNSHVEKLDNSESLNGKKLLARKNFLNLLKQISIFPPTYIVDLNSIFNKWIASDEMLEHFKCTGTETTLNLNIAGIVTILEDNDLLQEIMSVKPELIFQIDTKHVKAVNPSKFCNSDLDPQIHLLTLPLMIAIDFVNVDLTKTILSNKGINKEFISLIKECSGYAKFTYNREIYHNSFIDEHNQINERYINQKVIKSILSKAIIEAEKNIDRTI